MEFSVEKFPSHRKGEEVRVEILQAVMEMPEITVYSIAARIRKSQRQTERHLQRLVAEGKIHKSGVGYSIGRKVI